MDKNAIKKYAVWARNELIARVTQKAEQYEITAEKITPADANSIGGRLLTNTEKNQRKALIDKIKADGFEQVMEEVAYTWFNRFTALRFMEVNNYLPSHTRVFTNENGEFKPQILDEAIHLDLDGLDMDKVYELKNANKTEELYKYLLITQCNALSSILPRMFQKIEHYTELLLPDYLLREGSVIEQMIALIPEEDWTDQVQIIGWLYQYYNSEPKDAVFAALKKNVKISKENIPAATQLFTPDWIVRYMVENSLGRLWLEGHPNDALKSEWKYYLDEAEQEENVQMQLDEIRKEYAQLKPEEIRCIDPCMGSGHILCYMFDVLVKIYEDYGYTAREAAINIVESNLWGLDIDERAAQLSYFAVMMKARQYDRRFFNKKDENGELAIPQPHVYAIEESNGITFAPLHDMGIGMSQEDYGKSVKQIMTLIEEFHDAKEYGSIINVNVADWDLLRKFAVPRWESEGGQIEMNIHGEVEAASRLQNLINLGQTLSQKYHAVVTNPPYMGSAGMGNKLSSYVKDNYPETKSDLSTVFMEKTIGMCTQYGYMGMINIPVWMFISSYEKLRDHIIRDNTITTMVHPGRGIFGSDFGSTTFVISQNHVSKYKGYYLRLFLKQGDVETPEVREQAFFARIGAHVARQDDFLRIPGNPIAYWLKNISIFDFPNLKKYIDARIGMVSGDNDRFLRLWHEVSFVNIEFRATPGNDPMERKWYPLQKGGDFRKWYGNESYVINWENDGHELKFDNYMGKRVRSHNYNGTQQFKEGITWNSISASKFHCRYSPIGFTNDAAGPLCEVTRKDYLWTILGFLSSKVAEYVFSIINPTINFPSGYLESLPFDIGENQKADVDELVRECVTLSKEEWNSYEMSWDFQEHPFVMLAKKARALNETYSIQQAYSDWERIAEERFEKIKEDEEKLNNIFINYYHLNEELSATMSDEDITIRKANIQTDIRSFISYAVGCMFGRYSLDVPGLVFAGGEWEKSKYIDFVPDEDAIIPICDDEYFSDDIVGRFVKFVEVVFGKDTLEANLRFIADALGGKGAARDIIRNYFINDFYSDHCSAYSVTGSGKRPIYWLFDSGKKNGFKCLVYMHRYQSDTIARIRTDYVHEQQSRYRTAIADLEQRVNGASTSDRVKLNKKLSALQAQATEIRSYEEKIHHLADQMISIDLDDGVKHNYEIFKDVLAKIK